MLMAALGLLHILLLLDYDLSHPEIFFHADRAPSRQEAIDGFLRATAGQGSLIGWLTDHGIVGDYAVHALLLLLGGKVSLIMFQVVLALLAGYAVYRTVLLLGGSTRLCLLAASLYLVLPHTFVFPHQLSSEAFHSPMMAISLWLAAEGLIGTRSTNRIFLVIAAGLLTGSAILIRPITLLWPLVVAVVIWRSARFRDASIWLLTAYAPVVLWMGLMLMQTGLFSLGTSSHDLGHNLYQRAVRISKTMPQEMAVAAQQTFLTQGEIGSLPSTEYVRFCIAYPLPSLRHSARDTIVFLSKSGIERLLIDYMGMNEESREQLQSTQDGWRRRLESEGPIEALRYLWLTQGVVLILSLVGVLLTLTLMMLAAKGAWTLLADAKTHASGYRAVVSLLVALPVYIIVFSQVVIAVQSRHRAPAESAIVVLAVFGGARMARYFAGKKSRGNLRS